MEVEKTQNRKQTMFPIIGHRGILYTEEEKTESFANTLEDEFNKNTNSEDDLGWEDYIEN